jgi:catechol 2,3-dioxygenase-like lactoylglutathione lyase family enzyme
MNLNQVTIPSLDLKLSIAFYKQLGLKLIVESLPAYARLECPDGEATLSIHLVKHLPSGDGVILYFECEDVDKEVQKLVESGLHFDELPEQKVWLWKEARLKDPDNNQVILFHAGVNRKYPPWRLT